MDNIEPPAITMDIVATPPPPLEFEYSHSPESSSPSHHTKQNASLISQDDYHHRSFDNPADNTRQQLRSHIITQEYLFNTMEGPQPLTNFTNFTTPILDDDMGKLLEYCHLMKH